LLHVYGRGGIHLPIDMLVLLSTSDLRLAVYGMRWLYGVLRFLHLFGMASFFGLIMLLELNRLGMFAAGTLQSAKLPVLRIMNPAFALTTVTGVALFLYDPIGVGLHTMFLPKLALVVLGYAHARWIQRVPVIRTRMSAKRASAAVALIIWVLVIGCSTWNHIERPFNPADVHRMDRRD
jgi:hypothetical protein